MEDFQILPSNQQMIRGIPIGRLDNLDQRVKRLENNPGGVSSVSNSDGTLTISPTTGAVVASLALAHANPWTGLQTFSRAGSGSLGLGSTNPLITLNMSSGTYGGINFNVSGTTKGLIAVDTNGGMNYLATSSFTHKFIVGSTEMVQMTNNGVAINRGGGGPSATLDVSGTLLVTSIPSSSVPYVSGTTGYVTGDTNNIRYSDVDRFFGVNKPGATASIHAGVLTRTVDDIGSLVPTVTPISSGFSLGFSSENYSGWALRLVGSTTIQSANPATVNVSEPNVNDFDPSSGSASEISGSGYDTAIDPPPSYAVYAFYDSGSCRSNSAATFSVNGGSGWSGSNPTADVSITINPPNIGVPTGYYIVRNGSDGQTVSGSFVDNNTNWTGGATPPVGVFQWAINLSWNPAANATDYQLANTTNTTFVTTSGSTSVQDVNAWTGGSPTTYPTSLEDDCLISDGNTHLMKLGGKFAMFPGTTPVGQQSSSDGELTTLIQNTGMIAASGAGSYDINVNQATINLGTFNSATFAAGFTSSSTSAVNAQLTVSGNLLSTSLFQGAVVQLPIVSNVTTTGTLNNVSTSGASSIVYTGASAQTVTGLANPGNQKLMFEMNRAGTILTLTNQDAGSTAANRTITATGGNIGIAPDSGFIRQYDNTSSRWRIMSVGVPVPTSGGTGIFSYTTGDMLYASATNVLSKLAAVATGSVLISGGVGAAPSWSSSPVVSNVIYTAGSGGTTDGQTWNDTTQKAHAVYEAGVKQMLVGTLFTQTNTVTVANTASETALSGTGVGTLTLPANFFVAGKTTRLRMWGYHSSTGNPTVTVKVKFGTTAILTMTGTSGNGSNDTFELFGDITCRTTGATGTVFGQGLFREVHGSGLIAGSDNTATTTIDTTASQAVSVTVQWGTADAGNTISSTNATLEAVN